LRVVLSVDHGRHVRRKSQQRLPSGAGRDSLKTFLVETDHVLHMELLPTTSFPAANMWGISMSLLFSWLYRRDLHFPRSYEILDKKLKMSNIHISDM
jgi:hypothetical protein